MILPATHLILCVLYVFSPDWSKCKFFTGPYELQEFFWPIACSGTFFFPSHIGHIFLFPFMSGYFWLDTSCCECFLLEAGYFFIPTNIPDVSPGIQLSYLEILDSSSVWILGFVRQCLRDIYSRVINPHHQGKTLLRT